MAGDPRPLRCRVPLGGLRGLRIPPGGLTASRPRQSMKVPSLRVHAVATVAALAAGFALVFFYAPTDADQGFIQKIFYLHVPLAVCALAGFVAAAIHAIRHLRTHDPVHDARAYVSIHLSVILGVA